MQDWRPSSSLSSLQARAAMNRAVRDFFAVRGVLEVETPAVSVAGNTDPQIDSFQVLGAGVQRYLHTSPEYPMKRLLAAGSGDIYQICKVWRQEEKGGRHNPEFTLLEYYRVGFSFWRLMQEVAELLQVLLPTLSYPPQFRSYHDYFLETLQLNPHIATQEQLAACARQQGLDVVGVLDKQAWLDLLFTHVVEAGLPTDRLSFVYHYPAEQSALASVTEHEGYSVAERFEVYLGALELGNGYQELIDGACNRAKLSQDAQVRHRHHLEAIPVDQHFLAAMQQGLPRCAGIALGLDRILLCRTGKKSLADVIGFPWELA